MQFDYKEFHIDTSPLDEGGRYVGPIPSSTAWSGLQPMDKTDGPRQ
ncbi:hypothetical protein [Paraburkholderia hospita]|nr:hypothetical protein [Paraburkholderia hospita]